jgi:hypothetical protein
VETHIPSTALPLLWMVLHLKISPSKHITLFIHLHTNPSSLLHVKWQSICHKVLQSLIGTAIFWTQCFSHLLLFWGINRIKFCGTIDSKRVKFVLKSKCCNNDIQLCTMLSIFLLTIIKQCSVCCYGVNRVQRVGIGQHMHAQVTPSPPAPSLK